MFKTGKSSMEDKAQGGTGDSTPGHSDQSSESYLRSSTESLSTTEAVSESTTITREITDGTLSAFVGSGTKIIGHFSFKSMLRVNGHFSGHISSADGTLIVAAGGSVDAKVAVAVAKIRGLVTGDIIATERIELSRGAKVTGTIQGPTLIIEPGAVLDGSCRMTPPGTVSDLEIAPEQAAPAEQETAVEQSVVSEPDTAIAPGAVSEQDPAVEQMVASEKPLKIQRKQNVLGAKTGRSHKKTASAKNVDDQPVTTTAAAG